MDIIGNMMIDPARSLRTRQRLYDRYDALDEACRGLRGAIGALGNGENPEIGARYGADLAALDEIASALQRDRDAVGAQLARLDAAEARGMARELERM